MTDEQPFTFIKSPDGTCWGKWFLPEGVETLHQAQGRNITDFRFGGLYQEISNPHPKDFASKDEYRAARNKHLEECEGDGVEMLFAAGSDGIPSIVFLRPYPEV